MRVVTADDLRSALAMTAAIDALEAAFREEDAAAAGPVRSVVETTPGTLLLMPAFGRRGVGTKLVTLTPSNPSVGVPLLHATYLMFDAETQAPEAVLDGAELTAIRTAAVSGLATRWLARENAARLVVIGAGVQARVHVEAMRAVRDITDVAIVSRSMERAASLADEVGARVGETSDVRAADIVCTCTTSPTPVVAGDDLAPGVHVNAVGAYTTSTRELDSAAIARARVVVEHREPARAEAGELAIALAEGAIGDDHVVADLSEVVRGAAVRTSRDDVTLFKSVGMAFEDLIVARAALEALS